jgi:hypothetical protein
MEEESRLLMGSFFWGGRDVGVKIRLEDLVPCSERKNKKLLVEFCYSRPPFL